MKNIVCNYPLKRAIEIVIYSQYNVTEINTKGISKETSQHFCDIIMKDDFLNGDCAHFLSKMFKLNKSPSPKKKSVEKPKSLVDVINSQYLSCVLSLECTIRQKPVMCLTNYVQTSFY